MFYAKNRYYQSMNNFHVHERMKERKKEKERNSVGG